MAWLGVVLILAGAAVTYHDGYWIAQLLPEQRMPAEPLLLTYWAGPILVGLGISTFFWPRSD